MNADDLRALLDNANLQAFLRVIRAGESSQSPDAYHMRYGGVFVESLVDHPRVYVDTPWGKTSAAGAYQFLASTWDRCAKALGLVNFAPDSQDLAAAYLIQGRGALDDVLQGRITDAIAKCCREWASLPGSPYGQPTRTLAQALETYKQYGGFLYTPAEPVEKPAESAHVPRQNDNEGWPETPPEKSTMPIPALVAALLPSLIDAVPKLGKLFGSGSEVAERNLKTAELALNIVQQATNTPNAQAAVEAIKTNPAAQQAAAAAIESRWLDLSESGGGGIEGARKADQSARSAGDLLHSPSFWVGMALLPMVYMIVASLIGLLGTATWSDDVRAGLAGSIISAIIGGLVGYYFGQTTSRNRTPA